jgi:tetratricopeptide (TPR) repeat protein
LDFIIIPADTRSPPLTGRPFSISLSDFSSLKGNFVAHFVAHFVSLILFSPPLLAPKAQKELQKGLAELRAGRDDEARKHLLNALRLAPANPDVNYLLGVLAAKSGDNSAATQYWEKGLSQFPNHVYCLLALGGASWPRLGSDGAWTAVLESQGVPVAPLGDEQDRQAGALDLAKRILDQREIVGPKPLGKPRVRHAHLEVAGVFVDELRGPEPGAERVRVHTRLDLPEDFVPGVSIDLS